MINIGKIIGKFIRNSSQREIDQLKLIVKKINDLEAQVREIPDKNFGILYRNASFETQQPKNKLMLTKCIQKINKKISLENSE